MYSVKSTSQLLDPDYDGVIFVNDSFNNLGGELSEVEAVLSTYSEINTNINEDVSIILFEKHPSKKLIFSPTGALNRDYDDSRRLFEAGVAGIKRAVKSGCKKPLIVRGPCKSAPQEKWASGDMADVNVILGALYAAYTPLEVREARVQKSMKVDALGFLGAQDSVLKLCTAMEEGRRVARDIGGSDPERMTAQRIAEYLTEEFPQSSGIKVLTKPVDPKEYPLMEAVNRCARSVSRHDGRVVRLEYTGEEAADTTILLVGKGITYDTGGADIKAGGCMAGMHRDKCGAAAVAGFFKVLTFLKPRGLKVIGLLALVRNSVGSNSYVSDEIITSRAGVRVRIGNTDAEGRMVMTDLLCEAKELAVNAVNPFLFTCATLTGHVIRAYGGNYTASMDNGRARQLRVSQQLQAAGDLVAEPVEISTIRREDYEVNKGPSEYEDVLQSNNAPSSQTARGHMLPAAFMMMASGLDKHGLDSQNPLPYTHLDCAGSSGPYPGVPTGAPLAALTAHFVLPRMM